jgi:hypothetical protein
VSPGKEPVTLLTNIADPTTIAVDDTYVFFSDTNGSFMSGGIGRMALDGSGLVTLTTPNVQHLAIDTHAIYFLRGNANGGVIMKMDKNGGTPTQIATGTAGISGPMAIRGGNLYWGADSSGSSAGTSTGGVWTTCK